MVNTRQFSGSAYMQDMTKSHTFSAKNQGSTYTPIRLIHREIRYIILLANLFTNGSQIIIQLCFNLAASVTQEESPSDQIPMCCDSENEHSTVAAKTSTAL